MAKVEMVGVVRAAVLMAVERAAATTVEVGTGAAMRARVRAVAAKVTAEREAAKAVEREVAARVAAARPAPAAHVSPARPPRPAVSTEASAIVLWPAYQKPAPRQRAAVASALGRGDRQGLLAFACIGRLQQLGDVARRHQAALARDHHRFFGIGGEGAIRRAELFTRHGHHGQVNRAIRHVVHSHLRVDHGLALCGEIHL